MIVRASDIKNMHVSHFPEMCLFTTKIVYPTASEPDSGKIIGKTYNEWFSSCFGYDVILLYIGGNRREILGNMPPNVAGRQEQAPVARGGSWLASIAANIPYISSPPGVDEGIAFSDCAPYLVVSEKSWANADKRLPENETLDITKFRPNIVVEGADEAFEEDYWAEVAVGKNLKMVLTQNCARCNSLNVDYTTGKVGTGEAGSILKKLQKDRRVDPGAKYSPIFGRYAFLDKTTPGARLLVGDEVTVTKRNSERTKFGERSLPMKKRGHQLISCRVAKPEYIVIFQDKFPKRPSQILRCRLLVKPIGNC